MTKKPLTVFMAAVLAASLIFFTGCGGEEPENGSDVNNTNAAVSEEELNLIGGSLSFVREENRLVYLLDRYENIHIVSQFTDGAEDQSVCFLFDGQPAWASVEYSETSRRVLSGWLGPLYFYCEPGKVSGELDMEIYKSQSQESDSLDYMISSYISEDAQVEKVEELEPLRHPEPEAGTDAEGDGASGAEADDNLDPDAGKSQQLVIDEITGQLNLFSDIDNGNGEAK